MSDELQPQDRRLVSVGTYGAYDYRTEAAKKEQDRFEKREKFRQKLAEKEARRKAKIIHVLDTNS